MRKLLSLLLLFAAPVAGQLCDETFTLRTTACPAGSDCVNKGASLSGLEYDKNVTNDINVCLAFDDTDATISIDGRWQFNGELEVPASTSPPGTCTQGELYVDTDAATPAERLLFCSATDTWTVPGGGVGGGATSENELETDLADVTDVYTDNDVDFIDSDDLANDDWGDISISSGSASLDDNTVDSAQINNDSILAEDLYADNVGIADDILTFSSTADNYAWQTPAELSIGLARQAATDCTAETGGLTDEQCHELDDNTLYICESGPCNGSGWVAYEGAGGTGAFSDAGDPVVLNTTTKDVVIGTAQKNTSKLTVDGEEDVVQVTFQCHSTQTSNPECFVVESSTGTVLFSVEVDGTVNMSTSAAPTIALKDSDSIADPPDDNATISGNLSVTGDGSENMDVLFQHQIGGVPTDFMSVDADNTGDARITFPDSSIGPDEVLAAGQQDGYALTYQLSGTTWAWAPIGAGTPGGSDTQVQFNDSSAFGGDAGLTYNKTTDALTVGTGAGTITGAAGGVDLVLGASDVATIGDGGTTDYWKFDENGVMTPEGAATIELLHSEYWGAERISSDGTQCTAAAEVTFAGGPKLYAISCADNAASIIYGSRVMEDSWNAGTVTFEITVWHGTTETITYAGDFSAQCRGPGDIPSSSWGTAVAADVSITTADQIEVATTAAVTANGTCAAGDMLFWRWVMDDTTCPANCANTDIFGVKMEYLANDAD